LQKYQINWVLLPKNSSVIQELKTDHNWKVAAEDKASILMLRINAQATPIINSKQNAI
jgi:hypothetical protein